MHFVLKTLSFLCVFFLTAPAFSQNKIVAIVNDDVISDLDLKQRRQLLTVLNKNNPEKISKDALLDALIDEKLKQQEAMRSHISVNKRETEEIVKQAIRQNGFEEIELKRLLASKGISFSLLENQIKTDFMFLRAVSKNAGRKADISDTEINDRLNEIKNTLLTKQYLLSEIVIPIKNEKDEDAAYGRAMQILIALREGTPFDELAKKQSKSPSAEKGGLLGWIAENTLSPAVKDELSLMSVGEVSSPVKTSQGYKIIALHNLQEPKSLEKQDAFELMQVFLPFDMKKEERKNALKKIRQTDGSCSDFTTTAVELNTTPRIELGTIVVSEIPAPILSLVRKAGILKTTEALKIDSGELFFMACRETTSTPLPDKERIRMQIENERLGTIAERYLRDLRRNAIVEKRQ